MKRNFLKIYLVLFTFFISCTQTTTINLKKKAFNQPLQRIVWIQLAGLDEDLISYLSFKESEFKKSAFENFSCYGMHWESNLFELFPPSSQVMRTLITGKANINGTCEDFSKQPFWHYLGKEEKDAYQLIVVEKSADSTTSLLQSKDCNDTALKSWKIPYVIKLDDFHKNQYKEGGFSLLQKGKFKENGVYYDTSCVEDNCHNSLLSTFSYIVDELFRYNKKSILLVRDFSGEKLLKNKKISEWGKWIFEWNQALLYVQNTLMTSETLLLVTGVAPQLIRLPQPGEEMKKWISNMSPTQLKDRSVFAKTWAMGARSENFCGTYRSEDYLSRLFWQSEEKSFLGFQ